jgi:hypothetical protein
MSKGDAVVSSKPLEGLFSVGRAEGDTGEWIERRGGGSEDAR